MSDEHGNPPVLDGIDWPEDPAADAAGEQEEPNPDLTPEAIEPQGESAELERGAAETDEDPVFSTHVEWVRPTELMSRTGAKVLERGSVTHQQLRQALSEARREGADYLRQTLTQRAAALEPEAPAADRAPALAREEVSR
jgi:hypothetical protein